MRKFLFFMGSRMFWVFLGLLGLCLLIWFFGGIIAIGDYKPLASKNVRILVIASIFLIWLARIIYKKYREARRNRVLVEEIKASQEPILKHVKKDSPMSQQFEEIDSALKNAKFSKSNNFIKNFLYSGQYLYQMPWYVVLGAAGTGKTTVLKHSGLNFPLESTFGSSIGGLVGTKDCDWFLADEAVLLDTAGRLSLQDKNIEEDSYDWQEFTSLLKRYRPKQPINGVIVTIGLDDILNEEIDFKVIAKELRKRIHEMRTKFGISFPVYLMITKLDILKGFKEFFQNISEEERNKYLGFPIPVEKLDEDESVVIGHVAKELNNIQDAIESSYLRIIDDLEDRSDKNAIFTFSDEFSILSSRLVALFKELYKSSKFEDAVQWRGVYFTSATQDGSNIDPVFDGLLNDFKLTEKYIKNNSRANEGTQSYFIHDLLKNVVFKESDLASDNKAWSNRYKIVRWLLIGSFVGGSLLAVTFMFNSYLNNKEYLTVAQAKAVELDKELKSIPQTKDLLQAVKLAEKIKEISKSDEIEDLYDPPLNYRMGLYQGISIDEIANATYHRSLRERVMPLISYKLDELLRNSSNSANIDNYNALKAYLMLYDESKYDSDFMQAWLLKYFEKSTPIKNAKEREKVEEALKYILEKEGITPSLPLDTELVDERRQSIARNDISIMILTDTFEEIANGDSKVSPVSFATMGGQQSKLIFTRKSGKAITETINPIYTKQAYVEYVLPELLKSTAKLYSEEEWVLGSYASIKTSEAQTLREAKKAYFQRYISEWNKYISDISLKQPRNLREARDLAKILSDVNNSPLEKLIEGVSDNTALNLRDQLDSETKDGINNVVSKIVSRAGFGNALSRSKQIKENYLQTLKTNTPVDDEFLEFHLLTDKSGSDTTLIKEIVMSVKDLYEYLDVLNIAVEKGVDLPSNDTLFRYRAEVNRLPSPFRQMFDQFSVFVLNKSLDEMNERLRLVKDEERQKEEQRKQEIEEERQRQDEKEKQAKLEQEQLRAEQQEAQEQARIELKKKRETDLLVSLEGQLQPLTRYCESSIKSAYPFVKSSDDDTSITTFKKLFADDGSYYNFMKLSPETAALASATTLNELLVRDERYRSKFSSIYNVMPINKKYFLINEGELGFDTNIRVVSMNPGIEKLVFNFDNRSYSYSHGPIIPLKVSWPAKRNKQVSMVAYSEKGLIDKVEKSGPWGLFRLVEDGDMITNGKDKTIVRYFFDDKEAIIEFSTRPANNPFNLRLLRNFRCP